MITSISTNFGMNQIALKCYDSAKIVVLQGSFIIDTNNEDYKNSEQIEIEFPSNFSIRNSKPTSAFIVCHKDDLRCGTIIKAQIQDNKLIIEKLPIYDGQGTVKIILASGFVSDANESQLSPVSSSIITMSAKDYNYSASIAEYADCIQDKWGMLYVLMSSWGYAPGVENEYNITGLPSDLCIDVPVFTIDYHRELEGSECIVAHIENGTITFTGNGQENQKKRYLNRAFMKFFFVSDASEASE